MSTAEESRGALAIVLHTHMPYVEGFGTWPFGEEWLWEAMAGCYLPLLDLLEAGAPLSLSLTPVLCDQLEAPGVKERFGAFVGEVRRYTHEEDAKGLRVGGHEELACEVERSWGDYERALERFARCGGDLLGALAPYAQWTSSATHAVLPLLATNAGVRAQVQTGIEAHRARFGAEGWRGGFWLPECAYAPWLTPALADAGVHATCVELTDRFGLGARDHLRPFVGEDGVTLVPIDRATIKLVWSDGGYPADGHYRDYHHHTVHHHTPWGNDGDAYNHAQAVALTKEHAADFVARTRERLRRDGAGLPGGGLAVCALDTELLGHWWYEGITWLAAVVEECSRQDLELVRLDDALERLERAPLAGRMRSRRRARMRWRRAAGARTATCRRGRDRRSPSWRLRRARPSFEDGGGSGGGSGGGARVAGAAGERLDLHALPWPGRAVCARAVRRAPPGTPRALAEGPRASEGIT